MTSPETLRRYLLFDGQENGILGQIAKLGVEHSIEAGDWLFYQDDYAHSIYLIEAGKVALIKNMDPQGKRQVTVGAMGKDEIIGWSSLVAPYDYTVGAQVTQKAKVVVLDGRALRKLLDDNPEAGYHLMKKLTEMIGERLTSTYPQLNS